MFNEQYEHDSREYQKAKQRASRIEKPCRAWNALEDARSVWDDMSVRALGMCGWDDAGQHARDEICDATMIAVSSGGTYRTWTCRRHTSEGSCIEGSVMPDSIVSTSKLRLISKKRSGWFQKKFQKKMRRCHYCTVFFFFFFFHARHQAGEEPFLKRGEECRKRRFAHGSFLLRELIWKWEHIVVSACSHRKRSNGVIETWVRWVFAVWIIEEVWTLTLIIIGFIGESLMIYDGLGSEDRLLTAWVCRCERLQFGISVPGLVEVGGVCL